MELNSFSSVDDLNGVFNLRLLNAPAELSALRGRQRIVRFPPSSDHLRSNRHAPLPHPVRPPPTQSDLPHVEGPAQQVQIPGVGGLEQLGAVHHGDGDPQGGPDVG